MSLKFKVVSKDSELPVKFRGKLMHNDSGHHFKAIVSEGRLVAYMAYTLSGEHCSVKFVSSLKRKLTDNAGKQLTAAFRKQAGIYPSRYLIEELIRNGVREFRHHNPSSEIQQMLKRAKRAKLIKATSGPSIRVTPLWRKTSNARRRLP